MQKVNKKILDVSEEFYLKGNKDAKHGFVTPNNFYNLKAFSDYEELDLIFSRNFLNKTKFHRILLKEWFNFCKVGGRIEIEFSDNELLNFKKAIEEINLLLGKKVEIIERVKTDSNRIILRKKEPALRKVDSMDKWSFGIITNGSKEDALENQIESIIRQKIPHFEIIVCGPYKPKEKYKKFVKVIPFEPKIAWITKKKNLIFKKAKYENIVITHNRFIFDKDWYKGMKEYGNYFEVLTCKIMSPSGKRAGDWLTYGLDLKNRWYNRMGLLEYRDWDNHLLINGSYYILKKETWRKCPWNESLIWGQFEDDVLSYDFHNKGIVPRFNSYSIMHTFPENYGNWHWIYTFNYKKLGKIPFELSIKWFKRKINYLLRRYTSFGIVLKPTHETYGW